MKTELKRCIQTAWQIVTEVPGWPDAPSRVRLQRAAPVLLPALLLAGLIGWTLLALTPDAVATRGQLQPLLSLEQEISTLQLACSEQEVQEIAERAAVASRLLLANADELAPLLKSLKKTANDFGWNATLVATDGTVDEPASDSQVTFLPVRGKLVPTAGNTDPFSSLLALFERFSSVGKRIDLMRLVVRADDHRWQSVEINLRLAGPPHDAKAP